MRLTALATLVSAALAALTAPAQAAWKSYISHPLGFAFAAPGDLKVEKGSYRGEVAGPYDAIVYRFVDDNIEYKAVVVDMTDKANEAATTLVAVFTVDPLSRSVHIYKRRDRVCARVRGPSRRRGSQRSTSE